MKPWTAVLLLGTALVLAYEIRANIGDEYPTITAMLRYAAEYSPMVAVLFGILIGHLFWNR